MVDQIREVEETTNGGTPVQTTKRVTTRSGDSTAERVIYYLVGLLATVLAIRFVLSLLGANRANGFADFIYSISHPLVAPFFGLFNYQVKYGVSHFEIETLVAIAVYALVGYGLAQIVRIARKAD